MSDLSRMSKVDPECVRCEGTGNARYERDSPRSTGCPRCGGSGKGDRKVREDGKVLKPDRFVPPDMSEAIDGWRS